MLHHISTAVKKKRRKCFVLLRPTSSNFVILPTSARKCGLKQTSLTSHCSPHLTQKRTQFALPATTRRGVRPTNAQNQLKKSGNLQTLSKRGHQSNAVAIGQNGASRNGSNTISQNIVHFQFRRLFKGVPQDRH